MKKRLGFVSNSSSTSFYFFTKGGGVDKVLECIQRHQEKFRLKTDFEFSPEYSCTADDVCDAIRGLSKKLIGVTSLMGEAASDIRQWEEDSKSSDSWTSDFAAEYLAEARERLLDLENLRSLGFTQALVVGFGDNHGDIEGGNVGNAMDYEGREIRIDDDDFKLRTEQNR